MLGRNPKCKSFIHVHSQYLIAQRIPTTKYLDCPLWHEWDRESARALAAALLHRDVDHACCQFPVFATRLAAVPKNVISKLIEKMRFWRSQFLYSKNWAPTWPQRVYGFLSKFPTLSYQTSLCWNRGNLSLDHISHRFQLSRVEENTRSTRGSPPNV